MPMEYGLFMVVKFTIYSKKTSVKISVRQWEVTQAKEGDPAAILEMDCGMLDKIV